MIFLLLCSIYYSLNGLALIDLVLIRQKHLTWCPESSASVSFSSVRTYQFRKGPKIKLVILVVIMGITEHCTARMPQLTIPHLSRSDLATPRVDEHARAEATRAEATVVGPGHFFRLVP